MKIKEIRIDKEQLVKERLYHELAGVVYELYKFDEAYSNGYTIPALQLYFDVQATVEVLKGLEIEVLSVFDADSMTVKIIRSLIEYYEE